MFGTILNICIGGQLYSSLTSQPNSPNLYSCMFFWESMEYNLVYCPTYDIGPIRLYPLIQVNEQILFRLQVFQSNIKSKIMPRILNYMDLHLNAITLIFQRCNPG